MEGTGFVCDVKAMSKTERQRHSQLREKLESAIEQTNELESGYAFRLRDRVVSLVEVAEWVEKERKCCPFFDFEITVEREGGPVWLNISGVEGVKAFLRMEFGTPPAGGLEMPPKESSEVASPAQPETRRLSR
jgi:hypothetical protein